ncbi:MAG: NAD(P)-binding domain-containing protein [Halioglobus sp.]|nr:NAD(P)-binding domain-containing protein [Halioglobus sp.]
MAKVAFIGLGNMGGPMANNLLEAGHELAVFDLEASALERMREAGAVVAGSAREAAEWCAVRDFHAARRRACGRHLSR